MAPKQKPKPKSGQSQQQTQRNDEALASIDDLVANLERHIKANELNEVIRVADEILAIAPEDSDALRSKVVALIHLDQLEEALDFIQSVSHLPLDFQFHKAYCFYRRNHLDEALEILKGLEKNSSVLQLEGQVLYRKTAMDSCINCYEQLISNFKIDSAEVKTNITAAFISGGRSAEVSSLMGSLKISPTSSFELAYNTACALIEKSNFVEAQQLLLRARTIGQEMLTDEEYTEEEIESELSPINVQLAYVKQVLGNYDDAISAYNSVLTQKQTDASSIIVATNNLIALKGANEVSNGLKKLDSFIKKNGGGQLPSFNEGLDLKLSPRQKEAIYYNRVLLLIYANKLEQARELVSGLVSMYPDSLTFTLLQATLLVKENKYKRAEEILVKFAQSHPRDANSAYLMCAQIAASVGHFQLASESLQRIPELQNRPAIVATLVCLKEKANDLDGAEAVLDAAVEWWKNNMGEDQQTLELIMHQAALFKLKHNKGREAGVLFEQLVKSDSHEIRAEAMIGLVNATARTDVAKAELYGQHLPPLTGLSGVNVSSLEQTPGANHTMAGKHYHNMEDDKTKTKKKRKRKPRYPKGYDPANPGPPPDPERWLPKRERSTYRPRRKDKRTAHIRGSQGAVVREKPDQSANGSNARAGTTSGNPGKSLSTEAKLKTKKKSRR